MIERRGFLGALAAGLAGLFLPRGSECSVRASKGKKFLRCVGPAYEWLRLRRVA